MALRIERVVALAAFAALLFVGDVLSAQHTGGSFGGGHFGGGSHSSGGGGYHGGTGGTHVSHAGGSGGDFCTTSLLTLVVFALIVAFKSRGALGGSASDADDTTSEEAVDVSAISLAIDWNSRAELQARLDGLARTGGTTDGGGLAHLLHETVIALRRHETSWLYAGAVNAQPSPPSVAEAAFRRLAQDARARYRVETVRATEGRLVESTAPELRARAEEGPGVVVVTLVVAARTEIPDIAQATDARQLRELMRSLGSLPSRSVVALEVVWSPSVEEDRMSTAELEMLYPELRRIDEHTLGGRVFCGYCGSPFAHELTRCPHCGGPASDARAGRG